MVQAFDWGRTFAFVWVDGEQTYFRKITAFRIQGDKQIGRLFIISDGQVVDSHASSDQVPWALQRGIRDDDTGTSHQTTLLFLRILSARFLHSCGRLPTKKSRNDLKSWLSSIKLTRIKPKTTINQSIKKSINQSNQQWIDLISNNYKQQIFIVYTNRSKPVSMSRICSSIWLGLENDRKYTEVYG